MNFMKEIYECTLAEGPKAFYLHFYVVLFDVYTIRAFWKANTLKNFEVFGRLNDADEGCTIHLANLLFICNFILK